MRPLTPNRFGSIVAPALLVVAAAVAACSTGAAPAHAPAASGTSAVLAAGRGTPAPAPVSRGGSGGNAAIASGDACALLTQQEVTAAMGTAMAGAPVVPNNPVVCGWTQPGNDSFSGRKVLVSIITPLVYSAGEQIQIEGITKKPVSGVGDAAYETYSENLPFELRVEKGGKAMAIGIYSGGAWDTAKSESIAKALALAALARL